MANETDKEPFGPVDMKGPGVDAWNAFLEKNDSDDAETLQLRWIERANVRSSFIAGQKHLFEQLATRTKKD